MENRTLVVDGSFLLKQSFNGFKNTYTHSFECISGLYGSLIILRKLIKEHQINKIVVMWDGENGGKMRYMIYNEYKANRKNKDWYNKIELTEAQIKFEKTKEESILKNRKRLQEYLEELFIRQIEICEIEGDDLIAQYCINHHMNEDIIIFTNDRDFAQLLSLNVKIIFANIKDEVIDKFNFIMNFGYDYSNALTMKVICGDNSDNIKGIDGIKDTTLLKYFPDLQYRPMTVKEICQKADMINKERVKNKLKPLKVFENLLKNTERLKLNYKLMNLSEPMLNEQAIEELKQLEMPLSPDNRGAKNLYKLMIEDEFLTIYKGTFVDFVQPFYTVIMNEKQLLKEYYRNDKK
jgi:5'-3' exonuclease